MKLRHYQLFPNEYESQNWLAAGETRTVPDGPYVIEATLSPGVEWVWVVASTQRWEEPKGQREGPFLVFRTEQERHACKQLVRGLVTKPAAAGGHDRRE